MSSLDRKLSRFAATLWHLLHSFRFRLALMFVAILALVLAGFSAFIYTRQVQINHAEEVSQLVSQSAQLVAYYEAQMASFESEREGRSASVPQSKLPLLPDNTLLAMIGLDGKAVLQQGPLQPDILSALVMKWQDSPDTLQPLSYTAPGQGKAAGTAYLFMVSPLQVEGRGVGFLLLANPTDPGSQLPRLAVSLTLGSLLIVLLAFGGGYWLANRALQPVQTIVHTAQRISESDLSRRLNLHRNDELGELADTFDQMLDRLQAAFERQRQFTADASHELRSPLAIIELESNRLLERKRTPEEYEKVLHLIQSENEWMSRLVNELLLLARMDAGQIALRSERVDLSEVIVDVTERLTPLAQARGVTLKTGELGECYAQAERIYLTQLLTNLVENALKYTHREDGLVLVESVRQVKDGQPWSLMRITDNGPGIPEEHLPHIFNRFYRLDLARARAEEGAAELVSSSGLGLAIAQSIAQVYGGKIEVHSQEGKGSTFTVWLPAARQV